MKIQIIEKSTEEILGEVITNYGMDIYQACKLAGVDVDDYDVEADLKMVYLAS